MFTDRIALSLSLFALGVAGCAAHRVSSSPVDFHELCGENRVGSLDLIENHQLILLGEVYGTEGIPSFAASLACYAALSGRRVAVAVKLPQKDQVDIHHYLVSAGGESDTRKLVELGSTWSRSYPNGQNSEAMLALIERVWAMRQARLPVSVVAIDEPSMDGEEREMAIVRAILDLRASRPEETLIVLTGDEHALLGNGGSQDEAFMPSARHLENSGLYFKGWDYPWLIPFGDASRMRWLVLERAVLVVALIESVSHEEVVNGVRLVLGTANQVEQQSPELDNPLCQLE